MNHCLNSLKGGYIGDSIGDYYRGTIGVIKGDARSLDKSSYAALVPSVPYLPQRRHFEGERPPGDQGPVGQISAQIKPPTPKL